MIEALTLRRFLIGRGLGLVGSLGFQIAVVRLLPPPAYGDYALVMGLAALAQTLTSLGLSRVAARILTGAGDRVSHAAARRLVGIILGVRGAAGLVGLGLAVLAGAVLSAPPALVIAGAAYAAAGAVLSDADAIGLALGLQTSSRQAAVVEPLSRLGAVVGLAVAGVGLGAAPVLGIAAASAALGAAWLLVAAFKALSRPDRSAPPSTPLDWPTIRSAAFGGYAGTLSWLAFSPAVMRIVASRVLPPTAFAGFSFVQALVVSLQRYAPSFTLFPLIEPAAMAEVSRTGRIDGLRSALSLLVKGDALLVGAAVVAVAVAGAPVVSVLTHGRYGAASIFLPWLLLGVLASASHRGYEVAAIALDQGQALSRSLGITLLWFTAALLAAPVLRIWPLLLCPLGEALTRFALVQRALSRRGASNLLDLAGLARIGAAAVAMGLAGGAAAEGVRADLGLRLLIGAASVMAFLGLAAAMRPLRSSETTLLHTAAPWLRPFGERRVGALRVTVLTPRGTGGAGGVDRLMDALRPRLAARTDVHVALLATRGRRRWAAPLVGAATMARLAMRAAFRRVDLIHVNLGAHGSFYRKALLLAAPRLMGVPYMLHLHGSAFADFWAGASRRRRACIDQLLQGASGVIVLGEAHRRLVEARLPEIAGRITVMPNACALAEHPPQRRDDRVQLLFLGELGPRKGSATLVEALARLQTATPWSAVIAGEGDAGPLRQAVKRLALTDRVAFPGWVGPDAVEALLAGSDILVLPSFQEVLPMAVVEAFAAGLAVIATPVGVLTDILIDGQTGLLVQPGDPDELAAAMAALMDDPLRRRALGAAARTFHAGHLALEPYTDRLVTLWTTAPRRQTLEALKARGGGGRSPN